METSDMLGWLVVFGIGIALFVIGVHTVHALAWVGGIWILLALLIGTAMEAG